MPGGETRDMRALDPANFAALDHARVLTVDGASGSGKTSLLRRLAVRYGVATLELGVLVRNVAAWAELHQAPVADAAAHFAALSARGLLLASDAPQDASVATVFTVSGELPADIGRAWSPALAATSLDDSAMNLIDRIVAQLISGSAVAVSGRTVGMTVCPAAPLRIRLHARADVRAERKRRQLGPGATWQDDARLLPPSAPGHVEINTSDISEDTVAGLVGDLAEQRLGWQAHSAANLAAVVPDDVIC